MPLLGLIAPPHLTFLLSFDKHLDRLIVDQQYFDDLYILFVSGKWHPLSHFTTRGILVQSLNEVCCPNQKQTNKQFYDISTPVWWDHSSTWEYKILHAECTSFGVPTKWGRNDQPLEQRKKGMFLLFHWLCNGINEIVSSGLVVLLFIPPIFNSFLVLVYPINGISPSLSVLQPKARCAV